MGVAYILVGSGFGTKPDPDADVDDVVVAFVLFVIDESAMWLSIMEKLLLAVRPDADFDGGLRVSPVFSYMYSLRHS